MLSTVRAPLLPLLALLVMSAVLAYDFEDSHFNAILADQLEDLDLDFSFRHRRDLESDLSGHPSDKMFKCKHHFGKSCCGNGKWIKHFAPMEDSIRKTYGDCYKEFQQKLNVTEIDSDAAYFSCDRVNQMKMKAICTAECVAKKAQLISEAGTIDKEKAISHLEKIELDEWLKPIVVDAISKCAPLIKNDTVLTPSTGDIECSVAMINFQHCVFLESEMNCPENKKKTDGRCKRVLEKYDSIKPNDIGQI